MSVLEKLDQELSIRYGSYASYANDVDPVVVETHGDGPPDEVDRLLDIFARTGSCVLDLGCGAGYTLCRLAPHAAEAWGFEQETDLLTAARLRATDRGLTNTRLVQGNDAKPDDVRQLPDGMFDLVLSRRSPNGNSSVLEKLKPDAFIIQELFQKSPGLLESFGRKSFLSHLGDNPDWLLYDYSLLGLFPVSVKAYYYG